MFNPSPYALDEATVNEWPGREVGVFVSIGTGRRPKNTEANSHVWYEGFMGEFAEARKKLIAKIEGCEKTHEYMRKEHLLKRGVSLDNYYRLNVEVGVGEFGMNEWHRLSEISTGTRRYMSKTDEQRMVSESSTKLAKIHRARQRFERLTVDPEYRISLPDFASLTSPLAVELPGDFPPPGGLPQPTPPSRQSYDSADRHSNLGSALEDNISPRSSNERFRPASHASPTLQPAKPHQPPAQSPLSAATKPPADDDPDRLLVTAPTPAQYRNGTGADKIVITSADEHPRGHQVQPMRPASQQEYRVDFTAPPRPPKTPLSADNRGRGTGRPITAGAALPYPVDEDDEPPPAVNMAKKPNYRGR